MVKQQFLVAVISLSLVIACSASAQSPALGARTNSPRDKALEDKYRSDEIERVRRNSVKPEERPSRRFPQIKEDFERIQLINSDVLQANSTGRQLEYGKIAEAAAEVNKRAKRLKSNLFPSTSTNTAKQTELRPEVPQDLKSLLRVLDHAVSEFVHNPIFENIKIVNPEDSTRAQGAIELIIKLSKRVTKRAKAKDQ